MDGELIDYFVDPMVHVLHHQGVTDEIIPFAIEWSCSGCDWRQTVSGFFSGDEVISERVHSDFVKHLGPR